MSAILVQLTDALVTRIQALEWTGGEFVAEATYADADELLDASIGEEVRIDVVVPSDFETVELETRGSAKRVATVEIVLRKKFGPADQANETGRIEKAEIDALLELAERLGLAATYERLTDFTDAAWTGSDHDPLFDRKRLRQERQFFSVILITFEIHAAL